MTSHEDDLDLLLSLQESVLETPPASPSNPHSHSPGYLSDDGSPRQRGKSDLSVFKKFVEDYLIMNPNQKQLVRPAELSEHLSDIRFVRLSTIKYDFVEGDTLYGCWATIGVLTEKGTPKTSSIGQSYCIWKIGCLDENTISLFLFGDAYEQNCKEQVGTVVTLFSCSVRKDSKGSGFSLRATASNQILKIGTSADYGVCKGKRKDGMACTLVVNKRQGAYCQYHKSVGIALPLSLSCFTSITGVGCNLNLRTAFRNPPISEGIYMVYPLSDNTNLKKPSKPVKLLSVEALKRALSNGDKVTTNRHSQGIRFLNAVTGEMGSKVANGVSKMVGSEKR
ncbi:glycosyl hydrolase family 35 family protein [Hibiscus syriacus]|uniref:Glycosyl hydrolase family 35 family protein n=1 Tax=Hibiscus syriacus TaxID=106335 RepID=A0A6A3A380_HIBSY|nr:glycosyl hydrolase family 35 family protein [Hibiscus syriacus]KAE8698741.1 glycosyl hydrolase family 35 family protein [Hibiscus syriacus]